MAGKANRLSTQGHTARGGNKMSNPTGGTKRKGGLTIDRKANDSFRKNKQRS